jgi:hypothetical protein
MKRTNFIQQQSNLPAANCIKSLKAFFWPLLLSATTYSLAAANPNPNLVANGSFESCGQQWTVETPGSTTHCSGTQCQTAEGNFLMGINSIDGPGTISQEIATQSGRTYMIHFAYAGDLATQGCEPGVKTFNVYWADTLIASLEFDTTGRECLSNMGWQYYDARVTASGTSSELKFESTTPGTCGPALDDVRVTVDPVRLATVSSSGGWTFYPFLNGGGSQQYYSTASSINTDDAPSPAPQAVYQRLQPEFSTLTVTNLSPTVSYRVRVHLSSIQFTGWQNVLEDIWVSNGGSPNSVTSVNPYASGFNRAKIVDLGLMTPNYPGYKGTLFIGISPTSAGKTVVVSGVEIFSDP